MQIIGAGRGVLKVLYLLVLMEIFAINNWYCQNDAQTNEECEETRITFNYIARKISIPGFENGNFLYNVIRCDNSEYVSHFPCRRFISWSRRQ